MTLIVRLIRAYKSERWVAMRGNANGEAHRSTELQKSGRLRKQNSEMISTEKVNLPFEGILDLCSATLGAKLSPKIQHLNAFRLTNIAKTLHLCHGEPAKMTASSSTQRQLSSEKLTKKSMDNIDLGRIKSQNCQRIVVLGAPKVGKTNLLQRFLGKDFKEHYDPTREDFYKKLFHIRGETYVVDLLDAACERDFPAKRRLSILTGDIFLLVFSLDSRESFREVCELLSEIKSAKAKFLKMKTPVKVPVVVCGNKADLSGQHRLMSRSEVVKSLSEDITYVETSAKTCVGLEILFRALARFGGLPEETIPSGHELIPIVSCQSLCAGQRGRKSSKTQKSAPCGAVDPLARRPSFTTDLKMVLGSSAKQNKPERCQIQ